MPSFRFLKSLQDQGGDEYLGNIWGWKYSFYGLGIILFFLALFLFRIYTNPNPNYEEQPLIETPSVRVAE